MTVFNEAYHFALEKHKGQLRVDGEPYFNHLLRVVENLGNDGTSICTIGILHDILEDTDTHFYDLYNNWGNRISHAVAILTRDPNETYEEYIEQIKNSNDPYVKKVKIADLKDNLRTIDVYPDPEKRERLKKRYEKALKDLTEDE